ncbi:MarR family transcriptional regulator [Pacificoceanicola onchidii]|uniref:MarR family transcriptional regulator n=1 Tax=Pacificoceanicola onchidii TaxID=2562685 RepID=UPI0010A62D2E|nr:MarR family transcriptional regulator [Pacificoceanicola onchidii]
MADWTNLTFAAVLTGDLVSSRKQDSAMVDRAMTVLHGAVAEFAEDYALPPDAFVFDRYRGDGWQVFLPEGDMALRAALRLIATLTKHPDLPLSTRIGVGLGAAQLPGSRDLGAARGEAFTEAGDVLDGMDRHQRLAFPDRIGPSLQAIAGLLDWQSQNWTPAQAAALFEALRNQSPTQEEIATQFGVSRQAVQIRLSKAGAKAILEAIEAYESQIQETWERRA